MAYDDQLDEHEYTKGNVDSFKTYVNSLNARNGTCFELTFDKIVEVLKAKNLQG